MLGPSRVADRISEIHPSLQALLSQEQILLPQR